MIAFLVISECDCSGLSYTQIHSKFLVSAAERAQALFRQDRMTRGPANTGPWGVDLEGRNLTVRPGDSFFDYANGVALSQLVIPPEKTSWGSFAALDEDNLKKLQTLLLRSDNAKLGVFYRSFLDTQRVEDLGTSPLEEDLSRVRDVTNHSEFAKLAGSSVESFIPCPFALYIGADERGDKYVVQLGQGGLGLPRDYYLQESFADKKEAYRKQMKEMFSLVGSLSSDAEEKANNVLAFEERIANVSWSPAEMRDPIKMYQAMSPADMSAQAPGFDWDGFFKSAGPIPLDSKLVVSSLSGVVGIARILSETGIETVKAWAEYHLVSSAAGVLPQKFIDTSFQLTKALSGQEQISPRWKRGVRITGAYMGEELGKLYVEDYFPQDSKQQVEFLCSKLKEAFKERLSNLDWMTKSTQKLALAKLEKLSVKVGFPEKFRSYEKLVVHEADLFGNVVRATAFNWAYDFQQLGKTVDRDDWDGLVPQVVNAFNMPDRNQIIFPAGILQPPFFDPLADSAVNFGAIGAVIGHEMTHSFDDSGRQYDADGQLSDWWTKADEKNFMERAAHYAQQFASFDTGVHGLNINPELTMGEDLADFGGINIALDAYRLSLSSADSSLAPPLVVQGKANEGVRRFFLGFSQVWRSKTRPDSLKHQLASDPHPPAAARVNVPLPNIEAWYEAFEVAPEDKLYRKLEDRATIW